MSNNINPYENLAQELIAKGVINEGLDLIFFTESSKTQQFLNKNIKNAGLNITIGQIIEFSKYCAFEEGKKQGKFDLSKNLKELLNIENPGFEQD